MSDGSDPSPRTGDEFTPVPPRAKPTPYRGGQLSAEDLITLNEEIAGMARAGLPLDQGLGLLAREMSWGRLQSVTRQLADDLRTGLTLPAAMERQTGRIPSYYAALLAAGVRSGRIGDVLGTLTLYARKVADFRWNLISALVYPTMVLLLGLGLVAFVAAIVLPKYETIFADFKMKLPMVTQVLFFIGRHWLELLVLPPVGVILGLVAARLLLAGSPRGRVLWAQFVYAVPVVGTMFRSARLASFADLLGLLVDQAIPLPEALRLAGEASTDPLLAEGCRCIEKGVDEGVPLGEALRKQRLVPDLVVWMIGFGEKRGTLGAALHQIAQMYGRHADVRAAFLRTILPPILIVCLAASLGALFIFGLMMPMLELLRGLSGN